MEIDSASLREIGKRNTVEIPSASLREIEKGNTIEIKWKYPPRRASSVK
jgi:hypothetical protein